MVRDVPQAVFASYLIRGKLLIDDISSWLEKFVETLDYLTQIGAAGAGIGRTNVNAQNLSKIIIPLPPLNEQKRIVAKIEKIQEKSQQTKQQLSEIIPLLTQFRQSVLAAAFRGDLTADWRENNPHIESAELLLERIKFERRQKWEESELKRMQDNGNLPKDDNWKKKYKEPTTVDNIDNLPTIPDSWLYVRFQEIATIASNLVNPKDYLKYPHIAPDNIEKGTGRLLEFDTIEEDKVKSAKHLFYSGQILYSKIRPYLSKCVLINFDGLCSADIPDFSQIVQQIEFITQKLRFLPN